jgi:soluble lytic murein transglycosylase-like protein
MRAVQARFAEIERDTGISFSAHLRRSESARASAPDRTDSVSFAQAARSRIEDTASGRTDYLDEWLSSGVSGSSAPAEQAGGSGSLPQRPLPESEFDTIFADAGERYGLDSVLIKAMAYAESTFRPGAVSSSGAMGLMQLMPATAEALGVSDPFDPWQNVDGGARYLSQLLDRFNGNTLLAVAAYNCGSSRISSRGITDLTDSAQRDLLPAETRAYLANIERYLRDSQALHVLESPYAA